MRSPGAISNSASGQWLESADEDTGRKKRETMTMEEDVGVEEDRKKKKEGKEDGATEEGREGARWYVGAAVLESVPDREEKKESGSV